MCGIVGYIGSKTCADILLKGLKRLEYRGYDSSGIATYNGGLHIVKAQGKITNLEEKLSQNPIDGTMGIGHTRWATHGEPSDSNAHPHQSMHGEFVLIHNGIIENYQQLKESLLEKGYTFKSETDTEVLVNWIEYIYLKYKDELAIEDVLCKAFKSVHGAFGIVMINKDQPEKLFATRRGSPLVVGLGNGEFYVASDASPIAEYTQRVMYLNDDDFVVLSRDSFVLKNIADKPASVKIQEIDMDVEAIEKGDYNHFMQKEIYEQPSAIYNTIRGRITPQADDIVLGGLIDIMPKLVDAKRLIIIACGTSWHAGLVGEFLFETYAKIPTEVEYASEFRYRDPIITPDDVVIAITQSGETADTLAAIRIAKEKGATVLGICNVVGSSISRETHAGVYTHAGPEIGVASTKAFTTQLAVLYMMALLLGKNRETIELNEYKKMVAELIDVPNKINTILDQFDEITKGSKLFTDVNSSLYLGRSIYFPIALEGALKLKEISYIHAEGYPAAEMKHGPIALIDEKFPVVVVAPQNEYYDKAVSNIQEVCARKGQIISVVTKGDQAVAEISKHVIEIPECHPNIAPLLAVIPLQILSYQIALDRGCDVDQPRNLAKSVTVE